MKRTPRTDFKVYKRKIDVFCIAPNGTYSQYLCSTNAYKLCREAIEGVAAERGIDPCKLRANFAKVD